MSSAYKTSVKVAAWMLMIAFISVAVIQNSGDPKGNYSIWTLLAVALLAMGRFWPLGLGHTEGWSCSFL